MVVAILDVDVEPEVANDAWTLLHAGGRRTPALLIINATTIDALDLEAPGHEDNGT